MKRKGWKHSWQQQTKWSRRLRVAWLTSGFLKSTSKQLNSRRPSITTRLLVAGLLTLVRILWVFNSNRDSNSKRVFCFQFGNIERSDKTLWLISISGLMERLWFEPGWPTRSVKLIAYSTFLYATKSCARRCRVVLHEMWSKLACGLIGYLYVQGVPRVTREANRLFADESNCCQAVGRTAVSVHNRCNLADCDDPDFQMLNYFIVLHDPETFSEIVHTH